MWKPDSSQWAVIGIASALGWLFVVEGAHLMVGVIGALLFGAPLIWRLGKRRRS